jgi:hypothetical protein
LAGRKNANSAGLWWSLVRDEFDLWFKQCVRDISGIDLNNPPEMELPDLLSV